MEETLSAQLICNPATLLQILPGLCNPANHIRRQAEDELFSCMQQQTFPDYVLVTLEICPPELRPLCAVTFTKYCRDRTRLVRDFTFQKAFRMYMQSPDNPTANSLRQGLAIVLANRLGDQQKTYFICNLAAVVEEKPCTLRQMELMAATTKAVARSMFHLTQMKFLFEQLAEVLTASVARLRDIYLLHSVKALKFICRVYSTALKYPIILQLLNQLPQMPGDRDCLERVFVDLMKILMVWITNSRLPTDTLFEIFNFLLTTIRAKSAMAPRVIRRFVELFGVVYSKIREQTLSEDPMAGHMALAAVTTHAKEFISWVLGVFETNGIYDDDDLKPHLSKALRSFWKGIETKEIESILLQGMQLLGRQGYTHQADSTQLIRQKLVMYFLLISAYEAINDRLNYQQLIDVVVCDEQIPLCTSESLLVACFSLVNTYLTYTNYIGQQAFKQKLLRILHKTVSEPHQDSVLFQAGCAFMRMCRYNLPADYCEQIVYPCLSIIPKMQNNLIVLEYFQFIEELPEGIWVAIAGHLNNAISILLDRALKLEKMESEIVVRLIDILTRSVDPKRINPIYLAVLDLCNARNLNFAEPSLKLLDRICLHQEILTTPHLSSILMQLASIMLDDPKLKHHCCKILLKVQSVGTHSKLILSCLEDTLAGLDEICHFDAPLLIVIELCSIMMPNQLQRLLQQLIDFDQNKTQMMNLTDLILRLILRSQNRQLTQSYLPRINPQFTLLTMEVSDLLVVYWYLDARQSMADSEVTSLFCKLTLEETNQRQDLLSKSMDMIRRTIAERGRGEQVHWLFRYPSLECRLMPAVMESVAIDPLWRRVMHEL